MTDLVCPTPKLPSDVWFLIFIFLKRNCGGIWTPGITGDLRALRLVCKEFARHLDDRFFFWILGIPASETGTSALPTVQELIEGRLTINAVHLSLPKKPGTRLMTKRRESKESDPSLLLLHKVLS